jgi:hypothetical protein
VISLSLKLKQGLNALLPARVGLGTPAFEYSNRDFFEPQNIVEACWFEAFFTQFHEAFEWGAAIWTMSIPFRIRYILTIFG